MGAVPEPPVGLPRAMGRRPYEKGDNLATRVREHQGLRLRLERNVPGSDERGV